MTEPDLRDFIRQMKDDIINGHDPGAAAKYYAADYVNRNPIPGREPGLAGLKKALGEFLTAFPDARETVEDVVAAGETVSAVGTIRATHRARFAGVPATGRPVTVRIFELHHIAGGKIRSGWVFLDMMALMAQIGSPAGPK